MRLRLSALGEKMKASLFLVPMASVVAAIVFGQLSVYVDSRLDRGSTDLAFGLSSTVDSARAVLTTIAGATITFAGIAFSVSLLIIQLGSSQYSPRVIHTLFRDPFNRRVMGLVVGTFTYCLIVLRSVRSALEESGSPVIPNLSVTIAVLLGIAAILAIVAFINHSAHTMDISEISNGSRVMRSTRSAPSGPSTTPVRRATRGSGRRRRTRCGSAKPAGSSRSTLTPCSRSLRTGERSSSTPCRGDTRSWGFRRAGSHRLRTTWRRASGESGPPSGSARPGRCSRTSPTACGSWSTSPSRPSRPESTTRQRPRTRSSTPQQCWGRR